MTSRSSPWTFSRFLTKMPSRLRASDSVIASLPLSHNSCSTNARCCWLKVTTPMDLSPASHRRRISATTASASIGLVRSGPSPLDRWKTPLTRRRLMPVLLLRAEAAGKEDNRPS